MLIQPGPAPPAPRVSVIVTAFDQAGFVGPALESVRAQTLTDWEAVAVDDGSGDGTWGVISQYASPFGQIRAVRQNNHGVSHARNAGLSASDSRAPFVLFLDADDVLRPDCLEVLVGALEAAPAAIAYWGRAEHIGPDGESVAGDWPFRAPPPEGLYDFDAISGDMGIYPPSLCLLRRWVLEASGGFDYFLRAAEDLDFLIRASLLGKFGFINHVVTGYRRHGANATNDPIHMNDGFRRISHKAEAYRQAWAYRRQFERHGE